MAFSQGRSRLQYWIDLRELSQSEVARRTGWSLENPRVGWSPRMISFFCAGDRPMPPEALYTLSLILNCRMEDLNEWDKVDP